MMRYRKNGNPIRDRNVYVVVPGQGFKEASSFLVTGVSSWEEAESAFAAGDMSDAYGSDVAVLAKPGAIFAGYKLRRIVLAKSDLRGANFHDTDMRGSVLQGSYLNGADLSGSDLESADLGGCDLKKSDLRGAYLEGAKLYGANLRDADLYGANLYGVDLRDADLRDARLYKAFIGEANLARANLEGASRSSFDAPIPGWKIVAGRLRRA